MTEEQLTVLAIRGTIAELPPVIREQAELMAEQFRRMIRDAGSSEGWRVGQVALALVGAELDAEEW